MNGPDRVREVADAIAALSEQPVSEHPDALDAAHRVLVAELELLAGGPRTDSSA